MVSARGIYTSQFFVSRLTFFAKINSYIVGVAVSYLALSMSFSHLPHRKSHFDLQNESCNSFLTRKGDSIVTEKSHSCLG